VTGPDLNGLRVIVTGASSGIGLAIAGKLAASGSIVGFHHRRPINELQDVLSASDKGPGKLIPLQGDLRVVAERDKLIPQFTEIAGGLDALINNAGAVKDYKDFRKLPISSWEETMHVNATAPFALCQAAWPHFEANGGGRIINISSAAVGYGGGASGVHYVAAKAALEAVTKSLSKAGAKENILVNTVRCGVIETPMHSRIKGYDEEKFKKRIDMIPIGRAGDPAEVAELVAFLISRHGAFITGEIISISGGD
jgi:3-oxoacyl-[acyl-carrier protein] reductase